MPNIVFPCRDINSSQIPTSSPRFSALASLGLAPNMQLRAHTAYCNAQEPGSEAIVRTLSCLKPQERANLLHAVDAYGEQTVALAEVHDRQIRQFSGLFSAGAGLAGASSTAIEHRLTDFQKALRSYQQSLIDLNNHRTVGRGGAARRAELQRVVKNRYDILQTKFKVELTRFIRTEHIGKNRGNALVSAERGIALSNQKPSRQLYITDSAQAIKVSRFAQSMKFVGNTALIMDAGIRANNVYGTYKSGGNWQRDASLEATGFGLGGAAGLAAGIGVGKVALAIGLGATPVGWAVIITAGTIAGFGAANYGNGFGKRFAAKIWNRNQD